MESLNTYNQNKGFTRTPRLGVTLKGGGFTLIEIIVVIGIVAMVVGFGMVTDLSFFKGDVFRSEESTIVSILGKARSRAMANMFQVNHGVCYDPVLNNYVIFRGNTCDPGASTSELIPANLNIATISTFSTTFPTVVFKQLTGKLIPQLSPATNETIINIQDGMKTADIKINNEGRINW